MNKDTASLYDEIEELESLRRGYIGDHLPRLDEEIAALQWYVELPMYDFLSVIVFFAVT